MPGRRPLTVEGGVRAADQGREDDVRLCRLDLPDRRAEIGDVQREEVDGRTSPPLSLTYFVIHFAVIWP